MEVAKRFIIGVDKLVPRPDIALEVLTMAHDSDGSVSAMAQKIEQDPNLTANMLRMANSSYFGHMKKISSIRDIIVRLGNDSVKLLAITSASSGLLNTPQKAYGLEPYSLWNHSLATALLAAILARYADYEDNFSVYTAGLLHDIGKVVLNKPLQEESVNKKINNKFSNIVEYEKFVLGTDHAKVGMALLKTWGLPESIILPIGYHHTLDGEEAGLLQSKILYLANFLIESIGIRSANPEKYMFKVEDFLEQNQRLPDVPNFPDNMEVIINEFYDQFNSAAVVH
ncbi:MAG: HDOD domain-containing protein [Desulfobulbaceae bacterium]|nr:HDOD domain-containing protein [Desulfobulbaceae bacterium]